MNKNIHCFNVNGAELSVYIEGDGPEVLLLHGFPDDHTVWRYQIPVLVEAGYKVIAPDTRGTGESELFREKDAYHIDHLVGDIISLLDTLEIEKVKLIAHDWGAIQAMHLIFKCPDRFERYVAMSVGHSQAYLEAGFEQKLRAYYILLFIFLPAIEWILKAGNWRLFKLSLGRHPETERWITKLSRPGRLKAAINYYRANSAMFVTREWPRSTVPTLGIWSENDIFLTEKQMIDTAKYVDAPFEYRRLDGASHWLQIDDPEAINPLLINYLGKDV